MATGPSTEPLSAVDTAWFRLEDPTNPVDIVVLLQLDGTADLEHLRRVIAERLLPHRRFRQRVIRPGGPFRRPVWQDDPDFALDRHLHRVQLAGRTLQDLVGERTSQPLPMDRPLWQLDVIDGPPEGSALLARLHHCMADGFALVRLMLGLVDGGIENRPATAKRAGPAHLGREVTQLLRRGAVGELGHLLALPFDRPNVLRGRVTGRRRVAWSSAIPLERVKAIGHARGATVNDVLLAAVTGALRRHMRAMGDENGGDIRAIVPVNLRPVRRIEEMEPVLGNRFGLVFLDLPIDAVDPGERLARLEERMDRLKRGTEAVVSFGILTTIGAAPPAVERLVADLFRRKGSVVATNVPGPDRVLSLAGRRVRDVMFWVPHPAKLAVGISILSYAGNVRVGVRTDVAVVDDPSSLTRSFEEEMDALERDVRTSPNTRGIPSERVP